MLADSLDQRYDRLLDAMGEGLILLDDQGRLLAANERGRSWLDRPLAQLRGRRLNATSARLLKHVIDNDDGVFAIPEVGAEGRLERSDDDSPMRRFWWKIEALPIPDRSESETARLLRIRPVLPKRFESPEAPDLYRRCFEDTPVGQAVFDTEGRVKRINPSGAAMLNGTIPSIEGRCLAELLPPESVDFVREFMLRIETKGDASVELPLIIDDAVSSRRRLSFHGRRIGEDLYLAVIEDVTERRKTQGAVLKSLEMFRAVFETARDSIFIKDRSRKYLLVNRALCRLMGLSREELLGKTDEELFEAPMARIIRESDAKVLDGEVLVNEPTLTIQGEAHTFHSIKVPLLDPKGHVFGLCGIVRDITQRNRDERALAESEATLRGVFRAAPLGIGMAKNRIITWCNDEMGHMLGYAPGELEGRHTRELFFSVAEYERVCRHCFGSLRDREIGRLDTEWRRKNGRYMDVRISCAALHPGNPAKGVVFTVLDVTDEKRSEAERHHLESQLLQAQKMEAVGRLAGGIAHDFNNLLTGITGNVSLALLDLEKESPTAGILIEIESVADRAAKLVRQLLAFSRRQIIEPEVVDLNRIIEDLQTLLDRIIGEDIRLHTRLEEDLGRVRVDPGQIEQVLVNLVVNARDAMPRGGRLSIETQNVEFDRTHCDANLGLNPGRYVMITVSDTGTGMTEEVRSRIFEPFFTTKPVDKGTGLGLSTAYGIVSQHGGVIRAYSEEGLGSTFRIHLARVDEAEGPKADSDDSKSWPTGEETLLFVEDEPLVRRLTVQILKRLNYRVITAENGPQALAAARAHDGPIHLLMTDVIMPEMNGKVLADRLSKEIEDLKVLYISGYTQDVIIHHGLVENEIHFLSKPFTPMDLARKLRAVLEEK